MLSAADPRAVAAGLAAYFVLAATALLAGRGLLVLLRTRWPKGATLLLAAPAALALWVVALCLLTYYQVPLRSAALPFWSANVLLAALGLPRVLRELRGRGAGLLGLCTLLPLLMLAPHVASGLQDFAGVFESDGWSYCADSESLWSGPQPEGRSVLHAYASHLGATRHGSASLLAIFSPLGRAGDPQRVVGAHCAFLIFVYACACASLALRAPRSRAVAFLMLAVPAGWVCHVIAFSNYDHALALALLPAAWSTLARLNLRPGHAAHAGLTLAAPCYAYPELSPIFVAGYGLGLLLLAVRRAHFLRSLKAAAGAGLCALVVLAPGSLLILKMLVLQSGSLHGPRPGGLRFAGLLLTVNLPSAVWGLGGEDALWWTLGFGHHVCAALLTALALYGARRLARGRASHVPALALLHLAGALALLLTSGYHYGAYKLLSLGFWCFAFLAWQGAESLSARWVPALARGAVPSFAALVALFTLFSPGARRLRSTEVPEGLSFERLRTLEAAVEQIGGAAVAIDVDGPAAQQWAVYYLRRARLRVEEYRGYLGFDGARQGLRSASEPSWEDVGFVVTDGPPLARPRARGVHLVATAQPVRLWRLRDDAALIKVARNGRPDPTWTKLARAPLELRVHLQRRGSLRVRARLSGNEPALVRIRTPRQTGSLLASPGGLDVLLPLPAGPARVQLETEGRPRGLALKTWFSALESDRRCTLQPLAGSRTAAASWLFQSAAGGAVEVWTLDHGQPRRTAVVSPVPEAGLRLAGRGDFDGDGVLDLVFQDRDGRARVWVMDPRLNLSMRLEVRAQPRAGGARSLLRAVADLNRDEHPDLVWQDGEDGPVEFEHWCGLDPVGWEAPRPAKAAAPGWGLTAVLDVDADGAPELVWERARAPHAAVWYLDRQGHRVRGALVARPDDTPGWRAVGAVRPRRAELGVLWQHARDGRLVLQHTRGDGTPLGSPAPASGAALARLVTP